MSGASQRTKSEDKEEQEFNITNDPKNRYGFLELPIEVYTNTHLLSKIFAQFVPLKCSFNPISNSYFYYGWSESFDSTKNKIQAPWYEPILEKLDPSPSVESRVYFQGFQIHQKFGRDRITIF